MVTVWNIPQIQMDRAGLIGSTQSIPEIGPVQGMRKIGPKQLAPNKGPDESD